jgi:hypothetical protein
LALVIIVFVKTISKRAAAVRRDAN